MASMQKYVIAVMVLVATVASSDPIDIAGDKSKSPVNYRIDSSRFRRQDSPSATSTIDVPVIDAAAIQSTAVTRVQTESENGIETSAVIAPLTRKGGLPIPIPYSPHCIHNNNCAFIGLELYIVINILDPFTCGNVLCAGDTQCTHFTHDPHRNGGTCTLHKAPGSTGGWSTPTPRNSGCTCGHIPKRSCGAGSLLSLCLGLDLTVL